MEILVKIPTIVMLCVVYMTITSSTSVLSDQTSRKLVNSTTFYNTSISCTRGKDETFYEAQCADSNGDPTGLIAVQRLFYGTPPRESDCNIKAPYSNCCGDHNFAQPHCVFESDYRLTETATRCSGKTQCRMYGRTTMSDRGNCDKTIYPDLTSYSFIEYQCISFTDLNNICPKTTTTFLSGSHIYLDSNYHNHNPDLTSGDTCSCAVATQCGAQISVEALFVQLRRINDTECVEEIIIKDLKDASLSKHVSCSDHGQSNGIHNEVLFTSSSNIILINLHIFENHNGKVLLSVRSSDGISELALKCGPNLHIASFVSDNPCPGDVIVTPHIPSTTGSTHKLDTQTTKSDKDMVTSPQRENGKDEISFNKSNINIIQPAVFTGIVLAVAGIIIAGTLAMPCLLNRCVKRHDDLQILNRSDASQVSSHYPAGSPFGSDYAISDAHSDITDNFESASGMQYDDHIYETTDGAMGETQKCSVYSVSSERDYEQSMHSFENPVYRLDGDSLNSYSPPPSYCSK